MNIGKFQTRKKIHKRKKEMTRKRVGGKVLSSGGFGCVFRPALLCKTSKKSQSQST